MPLDPDDSATTARDFVLNLIRTNAPGTVMEVGLRNADGNELDPVDCPGYARVTVSWGSLWQVPASGSMSSVAVHFPDATAEWTDAGLKDVIYADGYAWDSEDLVDPIVVTAAGAGPVLTLVRSFEDAVG